jgi:hypothetical protein
MDKRESQTERIVSRSTEPCKYSSAVKVLMGLGHTKNEI